MAESWLLGIEIGGTKLQLGIGRGDGKLVARERLRVELSHAAAGIRAFDALVSHGMRRRPWSRGAS